jgi:hypothetical protein
MVGEKYKCWKSIIYFYVYEDERRDKFIYASMYFVQGHMQERRRHVVLVLQIM